VKGGHIFVCFIRIYKKKITWVKERQSMLADPTKKCLPSTTHNFVSNIPAPIKRLKSKLRTKAAPKDSNTLVSSSGADFEG
jgi:hypothetical protein